MMVPWVAVLLFWTVLHSAWATIAAYHSMMLVLSRRSVSPVFKGWSGRLLLLTGPVCAAAGPFTWLLLPGITVVPLGGWLAAYGLRGASLLLMAPYYGLVHPVIEQAHWRSLWSHPVLGVPAVLLFAGYHGLVLSTLMKPFWVAFCVCVLAAAAFSWKLLDRRAGGGLVPLITQVLADSGMMAAAVLRA